MWTRSSTSWDTTQHAYPTFRVLPDEAIRAAAAVGPPEGTLDDETQARLFVLLAERGNPECVALWEGGAAMYGYAGEEPFAYRGSLAELETLWRDAEPHVRVTPSNVFPVDRAWMLATDLDVSGTRVSGSRDLVDAVLGDAVLEAVPGVRRARPAAE